MENQETLTDICEELRSGEYAPLAYRIEEAWKRERGNAAAMREALLKAIILIKACEWPYDAPMQDIAEVIDEIEKASSVPPRNCDVGTDDEQIKRHKEWCDRNICVFTYSCRVCFAKWAQMPYEAQK